MVKTLVLDDSEQSPAKQLLANDRGNSVELQQLQE